MVTYNILFLSGQRNFLGVRGWRQRKDNFGLRIADCGFKSKETGVRSQLEVGGALRFRLEAEKH